MKLTKEEKIILQKMPNQWRTLLTLSFYKSVRLEKVMSMMAVFYQRQSRQSVESWDELLTQLCRMEPVIDGDGNLCFQSVLWSFPERFVDCVLSLLLRFQDSVSADTLDRFWKSAFSGDCQPHFHPIRAELYSVLIRRSRNSVEGVCELEHGHSDPAVEDSDSRSNHIHQLPYKPGLPSGHGRKRKFSASETEPSIDLVPESKVLCRRAEDETASKPIADDCVADFVLVLDSNDDDDDSRFDTGKVAGKDLEEQLDRTTETREIVDDPGKTTPCRSDWKLNTKDQEEEERLTGVVQRLEEALFSKDGDISVESVNTLTSLTSSQISTVWERMQFNIADDAVYLPGIQRLLSTSDKLSQTSCVALIQGFVRQRLVMLTETPSRQLMSCLTDLAKSLPEPMALTCAECLQMSSCVEAQTNTVCALCKVWEPETLVCFLRNLCCLDVRLDDNVLTVIQSATGRRLDLNTDLLSSLIHLLETGAVHLAKSAKYGRLVLNFVKAYKTQIDSMLGASLKRIASVHTSVIGKPLRIAMDSLCG